jgi:carbamoyltransferase
MKVLGISAFFHDAAAALAIDGEIVAAAQEERFSRAKHDARMPLEAVRFCLEHAGTRVEELDHVVFYEKPVRKLERLLSTQLREFPRGASQFARSIATWLGSRLWAKAEICDAIGCSPEQVLFSEHHLSHAASAFYCSPFPRAAVITADGVGEWATTTISLAESDGDGSRITPLRELRFPHSIGLFYSAITAYLGFEVNEGEYKVMGLAPYGEPRFLREMETLCRIEHDGSLALDLRFFAFHHHEARSFTPALEALLGPARLPSRAFDPQDAHDADARRWADIAASLQVHTQRYLLALARAAHALTGEHRLCFAGGVALNSVANGLIAREGPFEELYVQPAAGDAGGAIGAALHVVHGVHRIPRGVAMRSPFLGASFGDRQVRAFLSDAGIAHVAFDDTAARDRDVAARLARGEIGGWFQGRFEWGPRALGARSILADPRREDTKDRVNLAVKYREPFRPFAPVVRDEDASRYFDVGEREDRLAPFMLTVVPVRESARAALPAITHVDGTARVQRVKQGDPPGLHRLLGAFAAETGVGVLLNTSMNLKDEPLVSSPAEAYGVLMRSELDFLVLESCLISRSRSVS